MTRIGVIGLLLLGIIAATVPAAAQTAAPPTAATATAPAPLPPGPHIIDVRGSTTPIPSSGAFFPSLPTATTIPARGFGFEIGGHLYRWHLGPSRVGLGASVTQVRGAVSGTTSTTTATSTTASGASSSGVSSSGTSSPGVVATVTAVAPQISFNFGTADGWSYLSAGYGVGQVRSRVSARASDATTPDSTSTGTIGSVNVGGGARWFLRPRVAVGFDVRMHRMGAGRAGATPAFTVVSASAGLSFR